MARLHRFSTFLLLALLSVKLAVSADPPQHAASPAPEAGADSISQPPQAGAPGNPSPSPDLSSPPAPPPSGLTPVSSPTPSPAASPSNNSLAPAPAGPGDVVKNNVSSDDAEEPKESSGGLKSAQKAGIVLGVVAAVCVVGLGAMIYKKRQQNIQRSQYGFAARREIL